MSIDSETALRRASDAIKSSRSMIAFTGAGISVESGIPPFRGEGGIWERYDQSLLEIDRFHAEPEASWEAIKAIFYDTTKGARPNAAHRVLAEWESSGRLAFLVTQNIDGLHRAAGSRRVAEFHGRLDELVCERCGARVHVDEESLAKGLLAHLPPLCTARHGAKGQVCAGLLKPDFVFFGEPIPPEAYRASFAAAEEADLCLVVGSTGAVYPAALVPITVKRRGGVVIEIDPKTTEFTDEVADIHIGLGAAEALSCLDALLREG